MMRSTEIESRYCAELKCDQWLTIQLDAPDGQHLTTTDAEFHRAGWRSDFCPVHAHLMTA